MRKNLEQHEQPIQISKKLLSKERRRRKKGIFISCLDHIHLLNLRNYPPKLKNRKPDYKQDFSFNIFISEEEDENGMGRAIAHRRKEASHPNRDVTFQGSKIFLFNINY